MKALGRNLNSSPMVTNQRLEKASRVRGSWASRDCPISALLASQTASRFSKVRRESVGEDLDPGFLGATDSCSIPEFPVCPDRHAQDPVTRDEPLQKRIAVRVEREVRNAQPWRESANDLLGPGSGHEIRGSCAVAVPIGHGAFLDRLGQRQPAFANSPAVLSIPETFRRCSDTLLNGLRHIRRTPIRSPPWESTRVRCCQCVSAHLHISRASGVTLRKNMSFFRCRSSSSVFAIPVTPPPVTEKSRCA